MLLLLHLVGADPQRRRSAWLVGWIDEDPELPLPADAVVATCGRLLQPLLHAEPTDEIRATLVDGADVVEASIGGAPDHRWLRSIGSGMARRVARQCRGRAVGRRGRPAGAFGRQRVHARLRRPGDRRPATDGRRQAFEAFARASERDRADPDPRLDAADGDGLAGLGAWHDATAWAESAWKLDPDRGTAAARTLYSRYRHTNDPAPVLERLDWLEDRLGDDGNLPPTVGDATVIAAAAELPWTGHLPIPGNSVIGMARQLHSQMHTHPARPFRPEAPPERQALKLTLALRSPPLPSSSWPTPATGPSTWRAPGGWKPLTSPVSAPSATCSTDCPDVRRSTPTKPAT